MLKGKKIIKIIGEIMCGFVIAIPIVHMFNLQGYSLIGIYFRMTGLIIIFSTGLELITNRST